MKGKLTDLVVPFMVRLPVIFPALIDVLTKFIVGYFSALKYSSFFKWLSRRSMPVLMVLTSTLAFILEADGF